ncbi:hypothetical protein G3I20_29245, partial [Streptomyces sp. SID8111]|uniref:hypothetical protein n=1 Tax=Streptomyces sp. SID8111 TaxID=2706100 RepID=UPI0013C1AC19
AREAAPDGGRPATVLLLAGPVRQLGTAAGPDTGLRGAVEQFRDALALVDRYGARRLLLVTEDVHVTGRGAERPVPGQAVLGGLALAVAPESAGAWAHWVDLASGDAESSRVRAVAA